MWRRQPRVNAEQQLEVLAQIEKIPAKILTQDQLETLFNAAARPASNEVQVRAAVFLSQIYPTLAPDHPEFARRTHAILLRDLRQPRKTLAHPSCSWLVMTHLREANLEHIPWESAEEVASAAECFYGFNQSGGLTAQESHERVRDLVRYAGLRFAAEERWEEVFDLLSHIHLPTDLMDADLFWLHNTVVIYEQRRVRRTRRLLLSLMLGVIVFIMVFSPFLFMSAENPYRFAHEQSEHQFIDALYWSIMTSTTVGYGEIVPHTLGGRVLAIFDGFLGMTLVGVIAGLILSSVTPRQLP